MKGGDLDTWQSHRVVVILEGVLVNWDTTPSSIRSKRFARKRVVEIPPEDWGWHATAIKYLNQTARQNNIPVDVVTFLSPEVAEAAGVWFENYYVEVSSCTYRDFRQFCESLNWSYDVDRVIDSDPERLSKYGQRGYATTNGGVF